MALQTSNNVRINDWIIIMDKKGWMVRAGEGGRLFEDFEKGYIAVGWSELGDVTALTTLEQFWEMYPKAYPLAKKGQLPNQISMIYKFRMVVKTGDLAVTYDPESRSYLVGEVTGDYEYQPDLVGDYPQVRKVNWLGKVSRDQLSQRVRNSLGSTLTLFALKDSLFKIYLRLYMAKVNHRRILLHLYSRQRCKLLHGWAIPISFKFSFGTSFK